MDFRLKDSLPKENDPVLILREQPITYDSDDIDGQLAMLDRAFSGCIVLPFSKVMNPNVPGRILLNEQQVEYCLKPLAAANGAWLLGIRVAGIANRYDTCYALHIEGFADVEGNKMQPLNLELKTKPKLEIQPGFEEHENIALQAAEDGIVLLKNEKNALPFPPGVLNVFGKGLHLFRTGIVGAGKINPRYVVNFKEAIRNSDLYHLNEELADFYATGKDKIPSAGMLQQAYQQNSSAIIVLTRESGENLDNSSKKGEFYLSDDEEKMIQTVTQTFEHTIVILNVPYPIDVTFAEKYHVNALVYAGMGGMLGGQALLNVLSGTVNPSGKLPDTWAKDYFDIPSSKNFYDCATDGPRLDADIDVWLDTVYEEDIYVGYRYFDTFGVAPAFPFGYGLSYTTFQLKNGKVSLEENRKIHCHVVVTNTGNRAGKEVVQVYIGKPDKTLEHPSKELVGFEKTRQLEPGGQQEFDFLIPFHHLTCYDEKQAAYIMEKGTYQVYIGTNVADAKKADEFIIEENIVIKQVKNRMVPVKSPKTLSKFDPQTTYPSGDSSGIKENIHEVKPKRNIKTDITFHDFVNQQEKVSFEDVVKNPDLVNAFVFQLSERELCRLTVCDSSGWGMQDTGVAGRLSKPDGCNIPQFTVSDGNSGVNVRSKNIGFPITATCCATFDKQLIRDIGRVLGEEASDLNVDLMLVPALNIHRNPFNGRHAEYFSEDPYLAGVMAGNYCAGLEETGVGGCYKHCLANNCETSRKRNQSIITERALREIYFRAFELAMEVHQPKSIMTAYNPVNGVHAAADQEMIRGLFREELGFEGFVMTDWNSYDSCDIVEMVAAGNNWITPGSSDDKFTKPLEDAIASGTLSVECLRQSVSYLIKAVAKLQRNK